VAQHKGRKVPPRRRMPYRWLWFALLGLIFTGAGTLLLGMVNRAAASTLAPEHTAHDFGQVTMHNGEITAQFPITVREPTVVTDVNSS
jgi:hypothetical protein